MKEITNLGQMLKLYGMTNTPVGSDFYKTAVLENPDHFPEEYRRIKAWESIPQEVHDAYWKDWEIMRQQVREHYPVPEGDGIFGVINNTEKSRIWSAWWNKVYPIEQERSKELRKKHYLKYGV